MTDQPTSQNCPDCGSPLPTDSTHALCPACLFRQALGSRTVAGSNTPAPPATPPPTPEEMADKFPGFEITECLGRGGMGVVYKARQLSLDRIVAIKILAPERVGEKRFAERFTTEAQTLARLSHPNIVTVFDYGETGGLYYIVMEFVDGVNLRDLLHDGKLDPKQALAIIPPVCEALQFAHDKGIVHRDIKPENLLLDKDGRIKIADFGIASLVGASGDPAGTPPYMAPEQGGASLEVDHRADIYALGAVLYETLTGERPGDALNPPSQKVEIDVRIDDIVLRALNKEPGRRYRSADEFRTMVQTVAGNQPPPPPAGHSTTQQAAPAPASTPGKISASLADPKWTPFAAYGLITMGALNIVAPFGLTAIFTLSRAGFNLVGDSPNTPSGIFGNIFTFTPLGGLEMLVFSIVASMAIGIITLIGGRHMLKGTSHNWTMAGGIACCFSPHLWFLGVVIGVTSIVLTIAKKPAWSNPNATANDGARFSGLAIAAGALHCSVFPLILLIAVSVTAGAGGGLSALALGITVFFLVSGTVLGWIATGKIRRSEGKLRGRHIAILSGMVLPSLLAVPLLAIGAEIVSRLVYSHPPTDGATTIIFATVTILTLAGAALLGIRTCFRHLHGVPKNVTSKPVRIATAVSLALWVALAGLLWVQRPQTVGAAITTQSPDHPFTVTASTLLRTHLFGPDSLTYHFEIIGLNGTVHTTYEILVPWDRLAKNPEPTTGFKDFYLTSTDSIQWAKEGDDITATIKVQDVVIHKITIPPDGRPHLYHPPRRPPASGSSD